MLGKFINTDHIYTARISPALNKSAALECFECSNAIEIRNGRMFDFHPGLPQLQMCNLGVKVRFRIPVPVFQFSSPVRALAMSY